MTAVVVAVTLSILLTGNDAPSPRADNVSRDFRACLLVSPTNATDAGLARAAWQGMQRAARAAGHVNAQRFPTPTIDAKTSLPRSAAVAATDGSKGLSAKVESLIVARAAA